MKKKIMALCMCLCMLAIAVVSSTMAYFTDSGEQTNTFTAGKVDIVLYEHEVEKDTDPESNTFGDLIATNEKTLDNQEYHLYPAMTVDKDPTILVKKDSENAWVAAKITITSGSAGDIESLIPSTDHYMHMLDVSQIIKGGLAGTEVDFVTTHPLWNKVEGMPVYGNEEYSTYQEVLTDDEGNYGKYVIYMFVEKPVEAGKTVKLFEILEVKPEWTNEQMAILNDASIKVEAYATQTNGFADCYTAVTTAFPEAFDFN